METTSNKFILPLSTPETSVIISLLDLLGDGASSRQLKSLCEIEKRFFVKCSNYISVALGKVGLQLTTADGVISLGKVAGSTPQTLLTSDELKDLMTSLEKNIDHTEAYNYTSMVDSIMKGAVAYFSALEPELEDSFKQVIWEPNVISGEEFLCHFETGFGTGGLQVSYPNPNLFTDAHFKSYVPYTENRRRYRDWAFRLLFWLPHEALHTYDNLHRVVPGSTTEGLWQAEYLPTAMQINFTAELAKRHGSEVTALLHEGWFEELVLWALNITRHWEMREDIMQPDTLSRYQKWRVNSQVPPHEMEPALVDETTPSLYDYILSRLALESYDIADPERKFKAFEQRIKAAMIVPGLIEWPPADAIEQVGPACQLADLFAPAATE